jgi:hypothetical protein
LQKLRFANDFYRSTFYQLELLSGFWHRHLELTSLNIIKLARLWRYCKKIVAIWLDSSILYA